MRALLVLSLAAVMTGCGASLRLPDYTGAAADPPVVCVTPKSELCTTAERAAATAEIFRSKRKDTHQNDRTMKGILLGLGIATGAGVLADIHISSLTTVGYASAATTGLLAYANPSGKYDLYTDVYVRALCLKDNATVYDADFRAWSALGTLQIQTELDKVQNALRDWQRRASGESPPADAADAVAFLTALAQSLSAAKPLFDQGSQIHNDLPPKVSSSVTKLQVFADNAVRSRTGSYQDALAQLKAEVDKLNTAQESEKAIQSANAQGEAAAQRIAGLTAGFDPAPYEQARTYAALIARIAPRLVEASGKITECMAGI